eukprot:SM000057S18424  [mRNA]  locus=s57:564580:566080:+ [translate_table: standard]
MSYWLLKTEPGEWSWDSQSESGSISKWDGAQKHMRDMCIGDLCFFYHTGKEKAIVGIVVVTVAAYPDPSDPDGKCDMVDVCKVCKLNETVTLKALKDDDVIDDFLLLRQPRLSVVPVSQHNWERACKLGGLTAALVAPGKPLKKRAQRSKKVIKPPASLD